MVTNSSGGAPTLWGQDAKVMIEFAATIARLQMKLATFQKHQLCRLGGEDCMASIPGEGRYSVVSQLSLTTFSTGCLCGFHTRDGEQEGCTSRGDAAKLLARLCRVGGSTQLGLHLPGA